MATGPDAEPVLPGWPGMASFGGAVIHAGQFRNVAEMAGLDVLVVGPGNSGVDLLGYLAGSSAGKLWLSARPGMTITPRRLGGVPLHPVSLTARYLPLPWQDATARGAVDRFDGPQVRFADGTSCAPDAVICATGYRPGLEQLTGHLVTLDRYGMPPFTGAASSPRHPGMRFFGLDRSIYGNMHVRRRQARQLARAITKRAAD